MSTVIREATKSDYAAVIELVKELAAFEEIEADITNTPERMAEEADHFRCLVAETGDKKIVGMAVFYFAYYTWVGKSLYLDDLMVQHEYRGKGIGSRLLDEVFKIAQDESCRRVRWQVVHWNEPAIAFYKKLGANIDHDWMNCDFHETDIADYSFSQS